ncbi:hypothetical protein LSCM1_02398 [Leishmania martiniquensis]|uniref:Uncharacterized protein n=1 Tax=Leishmania martiniquensis TaxID=1580590 RepID=A0A836H1T5_9TRYP|nr:hypothetical protein LSCM1_02398 [Leishmania martiniquensis]
MAEGTEADELARPGRAYLTAEQEERLVDRLYTKSLSRKEAILAELDARYYPVAAPQTISQEKLQKSIQRQVDTEVERRQRRREEIDAMVLVEAMGYANSKAAVAAKTTLEPEEVDASVRRLYNETLSRKKVNMEQSERLYAFHPEGIQSAKMSKGALQESVNRMSKPKKTEFTIAEVNKIYGL